MAWLGVSLGWFDFSRGAVITGFLVVAGLSCVTLLFRWREITGFLRQEWRLLLLGEALFLTAFLAFVGIRAANPDLWHPFLGGEKQMEFAYFNAVIRSTSLPPFDPWFSGGYLNYYYWGYFVPAGLVRLTGIVPSVAFNLAIPLFFALTVTGAYSLVYNLAEGVRRSRAPATPVASSTARRSRPGIWTTRLVSPVGAGLLGALFVAVIGQPGRPGAGAPGRLGQDLPWRLIPNLRFLAQQQDAGRTGQVRPFSAGLLAARQDPPA